MGLVLAASIALPFFTALLNGEVAQVFSFGLTALLTSAIAGMIILLTPAPIRPARVNDALAVAIVWCFGAPIPAALPFVLGTAETSLIMGLHEAVSCLTTTGHSVIDLDGNPWPASLLVWRGVLHFIGMVFSLVLAASVFAALGFSGPGIHRSLLFTVPDGNFFDALPRALRTIFFICGSLILFVFSGLTFLGIDPASALSLAVSVASTGLVDPETYADTDINGLANGVLFIGLFLATAGLVVMMNLRPRQFLHAEIDPELYLLIGLVFFIGILAWYGGLGMVDGLGWAMSALSTSGVPIGASMSEVEITLPISLLILPTLIGGSALSTAGGIKLARIIILIRRAGQEFARLGFQNSIVALNFRQRHQKERTVMGVWVYLIAYSGAVAAIFVMLSFFGGSFTEAVTHASGVISNSGWLIDTEDHIAAGYHITLIIGMILGRLEVLTLLPALRPAFWRG